MDIDGINHINVYSKGATELGRLLSNFAHCPFTHPKYGEFSSIEGLWYWLSTKDDRLRTAYGYKAKKLGRELRGKDWDESDDFKEDILLGIEAKLSQNPRIKTLLSNTKLPLKHYYTYGDKRVEPIEGRWMLDFIESFREKLVDNSNDL